MVKTVFINPELCIGCKQCEFVCAVEHSRSKDVLLAIAEDPPPRTRIHTVSGLYANSSIPNKCRHCNTAPCLNVCPTGAITRDNDTSVVLIEGNKCITCAMCAMVCPFEAIDFYPLWSVVTRKDVAVKCDNCVDRQHRGLQPVCVDACKVGALQFGEVNKVVAEARTKLSEKVAAQAGSKQAAKSSALPANVEAWRQWGKTIISVNHERQEEEANVNP